jgi:predicted nuclease of predicted toxin-antitoxin system
MLKFKVDENMPTEASDLLVAAGHDSLMVPAQALSGHPDPDIAAVCQRENRALLTLDLDFADIRAYPPENYPGIIVLRLFRLDKLRLLAAIQRLIWLLDREALVGKLWIVEDDRVRIRG